MQLCFTIRSFFHSKGRLKVNLSRAAFWHQMGGNRVEGYLELLLSFLSLSPPEFISLDGLTNSSLSICLSVTFAASHTNLQQSSTHLFCQSSVARAVYRLLSLRIKREKWHVRSRGQTAATTPSGQYENTTVIRKKSYVSFEIKLDRSNIAAEWNPSVPQMTQPTDHFKWDTGGLSKFDKCSLLVFDSSHTQKHQAWC